MAAAVRDGQAKRATLSARKRKKFLGLVCDGFSIVKAAEGAHVSRQTVYNWRREDPEFAAAWDDAWQQGADHLEDIAIKRAEDGSDLMLIFLMKGRRPSTYRDNVRHEVDARLTIDVADAREQLEARLAMIEDHRQRALPPAPATDVA